MHQATLIKKDGKLLIHTPFYNARLVEEIRGIPGRSWSPQSGGWFIPLHSEHQARAMLEEFYQYEVVQVRVSGGASAKRTYSGGISIDGRDLFNPSSGYLDMRPNDIYEILSYAGGFVHGDGYISHGRGHAFRVEYTLTLRVLKNADWEATGRGEYTGHFEFLTVPEEAIPERERL